MDAVANRIVELSQSNNYNRLAVSMSDDQLDSFHRDQDHCIQFTGATRGVYRYIFNLFYSKIYVSVFTKPENGCIFMNDILPDQNHESYLYFSLENK